MLKLKTCSSKGLIQTGAWVIFYDFNCIKPEVLSVIAQQLQTIQTAKAQRAIKILFQETTLKLDATCNVFVVINPDYPGNIDIYLTSNEKTGKQILCSKMCFCLKISSCVINI